VIFVTGMPADAELLPAGKLVMLMMSPVPLRVLRMRPDPGSSIRRLPGN
jgi:hypothetical protein